MSDEYKKSTPLARPVYSNDTGRVVPPDNQHPENLEHRTGPSVPTPSKADPNIFLKSGNSYVSARTPEEAGITIKKQSGPAKWSERRNEE